MAERSCSDDSGHHALSPDAVAVKLNDFSIFGSDSLSDTRRRGRRSGACHPGTGRAVRNGCARCLDLIGPAVENLVFIGASHTQRAVLEEIYIVSAMQARRDDLAVPLLLSPRG